jgi:hypothetical protein
MLPLFVRLTAAVAILVIAFFVVLFVLKVLVIAAVAAAVLLAGTIAYRALRGPRTAAVMRTVGGSTETRSSR